MLNTIIFSILIPFALCALGLIISIVIPKVLKGYFRSVLIGFCAGFSLFLVSGHLPHVEHVLGESINVLFLCIIAGTFFCLMEENKSTLRVGWLQMTSKFISVGVFSYLLLFPLISGVWSVEASLVRVGIISVIGTYIWISGIKIGCKSGHWETPLTFSLTFLSMGVVLGLIREGVFAQFCFSMAAINFAVVIFGKSSLLNSYPVVGLMSLTICYFLTSMRFFWKIPLNYLTFCLVPFVVLSFWDLMPFSRFGGKRQALVMGFIHLVILGSATFAMYNKYF